MKAESMSTDVSDHIESIATANNSPTEASEMNTNALSDLPDPTQPIEPIESIEPMTIASEPATEPVALLSTQTELTALFEEAKSTAIDFFNNNRQLFITLGWIALAIFGAKIVFATLGLIDDIPLVTPIIKIVGLVSVVRFAWRYLIREHDRQELMEILNQTKAEVLGKNN